MQLHDQGQSLTKDQVTANAFIFVLAGYETTSSTISFLLYEISRNFEIQKKIQSEIDKFEGNFCYENLNELKYVEKCIEEILRKYPVVPMLNRICEHDHEFKELNLKIPKGTSILVPIIGLNRDPEKYENPLKFNPERILNDSIPFGIGQRSCPGNRMAMIVVKITIAKILSKFNLELIQPLTDEIEFSPKSTPPMSKEKILIKFKKRN